MAKNIVLIGMTGCGKSDIGNTVAKKLERDFIDTDEVIESFGMSIDELFESGEETFRYVETMAIKQIASLDNCIISTGGGVITKLENMELLARNSVIVFINRDIERIKKSIPLDTRPLLVDDSSLNKLYIKRQPLYEKYAHITVMNNSSIYKTCDEIIYKCKEII